MLSPSARRLERLGEWVEGIGWAEIADTSAVGLVRSALGLWKAQKWIQRYEYHKEGRDRYAFMAGLIGPLVQVRHVWLSIAAGGRHPCCAVEFL